MNICRRTVFIAMATTGLAACAGTEPAAREKDPDVEQIAREIGCTSEEVAICIGVNCEPEDFYCTNRADVRKLFKAGEFSRGSNF
jgi:hypothetical protein